MEPIVVCNSRWRYGLLLLGSLAFVVAGVFLIMMDKRSGARPVGWMSVVFFGACAAVAVWQLVDSRPRLIIDEHGINDRTLGVGMIPWAEITAAYIKSIRNNQFICLVLRDPNMWLYRLPPIQKAMVEANKKLGFSELNVNLGGTNASAQQIHDLILKLSAAARK